MKQILEERTIDTYWNTKDIKNDFVDIYNETLKTNNKNLNWLEERLNQIENNANQITPNQITIGQILGKLETLEQTETVKDIIELVALDKANKTLD